MSEHDIQEEGEFEFDEVKGEHGRKPKMAIPAKKYFEKVPRFFVHHRCPNTAK